MRGKTTIRAAPVRMQDAASMRPPQNAGENLDASHHHRARLDASMRPPQNAGENRRRPNAPRSRMRSLQ